MGIIKLFKRLLRSIDFKKVIDIENEVEQNFSSDEVFYISNTINLPEKLTNSEETEVIEKIMSGSQIAKNQLIERNLRLVVYIANKFENTGISLDDLSGIGTIGLIKAVESFRPDKNIKFATYASRCIENEILMYLRKNNKVQKEVSFDEPLTVDRDGNELVLADILGTDNEIVYKQIENKSECELLGVLLERLNPKERYIMKLRYGIKTDRVYTQKEVADKLNISQSYISRIEKKVLEKLKKELMAI